ncbi:MAG TPA: isochorismate synthase [Kofleriaceae bacterium]|nr:isochorismate synthase [Kofleriaceae bacterium]
MTTAAHASAGVAVAHRAPPGGDPVAALCDALESGRRHLPADALMAVSIPAPTAAIHIAADLLPPSNRVVWDPPTGVKLATAGAEALAQASGKSRFSGLIDAVSAIYDRLSWTEPAGPGAPPPRMVGGLAFSPGDASAPPWTGFGDAAFWLPAWTYASAGERAFVTVCARAGTCDPPRTAEAAHQLLTRLAEARTAAPRHAPAAITEIHHLPRAEWCRRIDAALAAIAGEQAQKLVAARVTRIKAAAAIDPLAVIASLGRRHQTCFRFSITRGEATFVGATPEMLIARRDREVMSEALAGSVAAGSDGAALFDSDKNRREHAFVVSSITGALRPFCSRITWPRDPAPHPLRHVIHLRTPITATLSGPTHILELAGAIHPTPAVGGIPTERALEWIADTENEPRGWYAAPVGWIDQHGDGQLVVAIRSALISGRDATLYAGAGIVDGSVPDDEYDETAIKERAILDALAAP